MEKQFKRPDTLKTPHNYCPGCGHGVIVRLMVELLEERGLSHNTVIACGVGCSCNMRIIEMDQLQCSHGRACAAARGIRAAKPEVCIVAYQGDGDGYVIGMQETLNAAYSKTNMTMIAVNNSNFGMTGGQMAWTTLPNQVTTTSPYGRNPDGPAPIQIPEMIAFSFDPAFAARGSVCSPAEIRKTKKYIGEAIDAQMNGEGFSIVEVLSPCPTNWGVSVEKAYAHTAREMTKYYPLGIIKQRKAGE